MLTPGDLVTPNLISSLLAWWSGVSPSGVGGTSWPQASEVGPHTWSKAEIGEEVRVSSSTLELLPRFSSARRLEELQGRL